MNLQNFRNKKVLILGFAREGKDTLVFLHKRFPGKKIGIADQKLDKNYLQALKNYDVIIKSPGIPPGVITPFITKKQTVTSQTEIFFEECRGTIIGITGTKGKSTTASLCYEVLKRGGKKVHLIGNIGTPVLQFLNTAKPSDIFIYELSSFQLTNLNVSPHIAIFLNLFPEHLDYYGGKFNEYVKAKANIAIHQNKADILIFNKEDPHISKIAKQSRAQKIPFTPLRNLASFIASAEPARIIGKLFKIPSAKIEGAIKKFKPLPHRLEKIGPYKGIAFYNDSLATIPQATMRAIDLLGPALHALIAGGFDRGLSFTELSKKIDQSSIKVLVLFPTTGKKILQTIKSKNTKAFFALTMQDAVKLCYANTPKGKICLLSPASPSFNMFQNYEDRGNQFKKWIKYYGKKA